MAGALGMAGARSHSVSLHGQGQQNSATGTRSRVARVRAEYPNQLDYGGGVLQEMQFKQQIGQSLLMPGRPNEPPVRRALMWDNRHRARSMNAHELRTNDRAIAEGTTSTKRMGGCHPQCHVSSGQIWATYVPAWPAKNMEDCI